MERKKTLGEMFLQTVGVIALMYVIGAGFVAAVKHADEYHWRKQEYWGKLIDEGKATVDDDGCCYRRVTPIEYETWRILKYENDRKIKEVQDDSGD